MKRIIFFDGDGTSWYPKLTKYTRKPHWIYNDPKTRDSYHKHLKMTPTTLGTLKKLHKKGIKLIILSTHPQPPHEADAIIKGKVKHFKLDNIFDENTQHKNIADHKESSW